MTLHDEFVFPDETARRRNARFGLALYVVLLAGLHLSRLVSGDYLIGATGWQWWALEAGVLAGLVWLVFARKEQPQIVVSGRGLGGTWIEQRLGRMLKWHRIEKVRQEPGVIVVDFQPIDEQSDDPRHRISQIRLPGNEELSEEKLAEVISDYMRVETPPLAA